MSQTNVIITSGSKNHIIHVPVVTSTTRSATPNEIITSSSGVLTINRNNIQNSVANNSSEHNSGANNSTLYSTNRSLRSPQSSHNRSVGTNRDVFNCNEDNSEIKTLYFNRDVNESREQLLLPTETYIKQEEIDEEEYEEYESLDETELEGIANSKTQYKCSSCGKGFCYTGWLDRHKLSSPACRDAHPVHESYVIQKESTNNTPNSRDSKFRPSLEGRLDELLCCPNENCTFVTHWVQSLNKHVFSSCKFGKDKTEDISSTNSSAKKSLLVCHICDKGCDDSEQHIQHMKNFHQIKLYYQCSECKINFNTKYESEAHIEEHNRMGKYSAKEKLVSDSVNAKVDNNLNNVSQQSWECEICNKTYLSIRSFEIHRTSCEKTLQSSLVNASTNLSKPIERQAQRSPQRSPQRTTTTSVEKPMHSNDNSIKSFRHFKREQIEAIHTNGFNCRYCRKAFDTSNGLCNHLSRRPYCREWYYKNLPLELKKNNSMHLMERTKRSRVFNRFNDFPNRKSKPSFESGISPRKGARKSFEKPNVGKPYHSGTNSARCEKCRKVFVGKNPTVALTNHLRGSTCVPTKYNPFQKPQIVRSRTFNSSVSRIANNSSQTRTLVENRFYCKLCPRIELKNRVSLGCHLTIYHGLPQVNVTTNDGDAFRCQTCQQLFVSKYFYNLHRQDCDLTSPYVGIVSNDEIVSNARKKNSQKSDSIKELEAKDNCQSGSGISCDLCGKSGFSNINQVAIHQKYQCVKRHQIKGQTNSKRFPNQTPIRSQKVGGEGKVPMAELAKLNDRAKNEPNLTRCDSCGRGPYNSYYYFMEHKKKFCMALKGTNDSATDSRFMTSMAPNKAKKSLNVEEGQSSRINESFCLNPTIPRARKTMNFASISSPQVSHDSSAPIETNENESEELNEVVSVSEVTKCSVCEEEFDDILQFIRHRLSHITHDIMQKETIDALECELCGARVHHYQRIQQHLILHLQNVQILKKKNLIEVTKKTFVSRHMESDDEDGDGTEDPVLHCPYCKSEYKSRVELADHIKNTCPFRYQCPNCNNTYLAKESYLEHRDECSKNTAFNKIASKAPTYKCRNCNLEFRIKQHLLWHEHACNKVYTADHSGRVEEVIERTLSCSVCGLVSDVYEHKVKHESKCLNRYLAVIGNSTEEIHSECEEISKPLSVMEFDLTSLTNTSESSEVPEELIKNLKHEFGIQKEVKVVLTAFDEEIVRKLKNDLYCERDESVQFEALKESFLALVRRLIKNDDSVLHEMSQESSAEVLLTRMLKYLGEEAIEHNGLNELNCFRQNLQTFLKLTIKDDTLILAYREAESVDEAIINMLNFECELRM